MAQQSQLPLPRVPDGELPVHPAAGECFVPALEPEGEEQERVRRSLRVGFFRWQLCASADAEA